MKTFIQIQDVIKETGNLRVEANGKNNEHKGVKLNRNSRALQFY